jgi:hypothetical protein
VLARDLGTGCFPASVDKFFARMTSRNEKETTKYTRVDERFADRVRPSLAAHERRRELSLGGELESLAARLT